MAKLQRPTAIAHGLTRMTRSQGWGGLEAWNRGVVTGDKGNEAKRCLNECHHVEIGRTEATP